MFAAARCETDWEEKQVCRWDHELTSCVGVAHPFGKQQVGLVTPDIYISPPPHKNMMTQTKYSLKWQSFSNLPVHCSDGRKERDGVQCPFCPGHVAIRNRYLSRHVTKEHRMLVTSILSVNGPDKNQTDRPREPDIEELERL